MQRPMASKVPRTVKTVLTPTKLAREKVGGAVFNGQKSLHHDKADNPDGCKNNAACDFTRAAHALSVFRREGRPCGQS